MAHKKPIEIGVEREPGELEIEISAAKEMACPIPDFHKEAKSETERVAMQVEFLGKRVRELSSRMNTAKPTEVPSLRKEMHCRIEQLEKKADVLEAKAGFAKLTKMTV